MKGLTVINAILASLPHNPKPNVPAEDGGFWVDGSEILCPTETACLVVTDFLQSLAGDSVEITAGWHVPHEVFDDGAGSSVQASVESSERDEKLGRCFIEIGTGKGGDLDEKAPGNAMEIWNAILDLLPKEPTSYDIVGAAGFWSDGDEILSPYGMEYEITEFLRDAFGNAGVNVKTGRYDPFDDYESGEQDEKTGFYFIAAE